MLPAAALVLLAVLINVGFPAYLACCSRERVVRYVADDAYYYFSVAQRLAHGEWATADGVTKTTGFHPLYAFLLAGLQRSLNLSLDGLVGAAILVNFAAFVLAGGCLYWCARLLWGRPAGVVTALLWLTNPHGARIGADAMEGGLYAAVLSFFLWRTAALIRRTPATADAAPGATSFLAIGLAAALTVWSRTDSVVLMPLIVFVLLATRRSATVRFTAAATIVVSAGCALGVWWLFAFAQTSSVVQGSAAVKVLWRKTMDAEAGWWVRTTALEWGRFLAKSFFKIPAMKWVISGLPLLRMRGTASSHWAERLFIHVLWVLPVGLGLAYAGFLDRPRTWYYVPSLVTLTLLAGGAAAAVLCMPLTNRIQASARRYAPLITWLLILESGVIFAREASALGDSTQPEAVRAAAWLDENAPDGMRVGAWHSGIVQYYTARVTVINLDGLANNDILDLMRGGKSMNQYWDERGITAIVGKPRAKMVGFQREWGGKRLEPWGPHELFQRVAPVEQHSPQRP